MACFWLGELNKIKKSLFTWELITKVHMSVRSDSITPEQAEIFFIILLNVSFLA